MGTKTCTACNRELPLTEFKATRWGGKAAVCNECVAEKRTQTRYDRAQIGGGKRPLSDELLDGKTPREVIDLMVRCRKWLESRNYTIQMSCEYREVKIRKIKLE